MRRIHIAGTFYKIVGDIICRAINPWKASLGGATREFSDFSQADLEEFHDLRNGIGLQSELPAESNRLWWTEGIDFTTARSAVLGPLVTTAGAFGVAPVKIIDFQSATYAIGHNLIAKWNTGTSAWDTKKNDFPNPIDAIVITDDTDEYLIVSSAVDAVYSTDGTTWTYSDWVANTAYALGAFVMPTSYNGFCYECTVAGTSHADTEPTWVIVEGTAVTDNTVQWTCRDLLPKWRSPTGYSDPDGAWTDEAKAYDDDTATLASTSVPATNWGSFLILTIAERYMSRFRFWAYDYTAGRLIDLDAYYDGVWNDVYSGAFTASAWVVKSMSASHLVSKVRIRFYNPAGTAQTFSLYEFDFGVNVAGYLADYANKLYAISNSGKLVVYSAAKNIDSYGGTFTLTGNYGTVYDLFEGKLLSDGSPALYFCGTEGLFSLDTTNEKAYKQEVAYPPLTYSGHKGLYWNANLWVATGYGILKVAESMATFIGPDLDDGLPSGYQGNVYDMATVNNWLVFCVNGGSTDKSSILKRNSAYGGNLQVYTSGCHKTQDTANTIAAADASDQTTLNTLLNELKTDYNAHIASTTYHIAADSTNGISSANSSSEATAITLANELKTDYNAHRSQSGVHLGSDPQNEVTSTASTTLATAITLANEIKADYNTHILSGGAIACLHHSPSSLYTNGRLWFGEGTTVKYMMFPDITSNVKQISTYQYVDDSGYGQLPILRKLACISKTALGVAAITKSCDASDYVEVFYGLNGADPTTSLGTFISSPKPTVLTFNSGLGTEFYTIQFAIKLYRGNTNTNSPELESLLFYYLPTPVIINGWVFDIMATEDNAQQIIEEFQAIRDTNTLVPFYPSGDPNKTVYNVKLTQMPLLFYHEEGKRMEGHITVSVEEIFKG